MFNIIKRLFNSVLPGIPSKEAENIVEWLRTTEEKPTLCCRGTLYYGNYHDCKSKYYGFTWESAAFTGENEHHWYVSTPTGGFRLPIGTTDYYYVGKEVEKIIKETVSKRDDEKKINAMKSFSVGK